MIYRDNGVPFYQFKNLTGREEIGHFVSTRAGGPYPPPHDTLNLSATNGDSPEHVKKNWTALCLAVGVPSTHIIKANQVHGAQVKIVSQSEGHRETLKNNRLDDSDGLVTNVPGLCMTVLTADCVPIVLFDPVRKVVGAVHAGWKGTLGRIAEKAVRTFAEGFLSRPRDLLAGIGPAIGPCCFEVGKEVSEQFRTVLGPEDLLPGKQDGRDHIDLWQANKRQLVQAGVPEPQIELAHLCTCHHVDTFFSYRCEKGKTGRFGTGIFLRPGEKGPSR